MKRYNSIPTNTDAEGNVYYENVTYPIPPSTFQDIYVYTTIGDRFDTLAQQYYGNSSLWWIISCANNTLPQNSLTPPVGTQLRIPVNPTPSIAEYEEINE